MTFDDFTFVLAYKNTDHSRLRNFNYVLGYLYSSGCKIIVAEQVEGSNSNNEIHKEDSLIYIKHKSGEGFKKSYLYNICSDFVKTKYIWFLDCDVILPIDEVIKQIHGQKLIKPFSSVFLLDELDSENLINGKNLSLSNYQLDNFFSKYSIIIEKDLFQLVDGFDESFKGWGWEDLDFCYNRLKGFDVFHCQGINGFHLYHEKASRYNDRLNYRIFKRNQGLSRPITICIDFYNHNFTENVLFEILKKSYLLRSQINICILLSSFSSQELMSLDFIKNYTEGSFLSIFNTNSSDLTRTDSMNCLSYLSTGDYFYIPNSLSNFNQKVLIDLVEIVKMNNFNLFKLYDDNSILCCKNYFDYSFGFLDEKSLKLEKNRSTFNPNQFYEFELPKKIKFQYLDFDSMKFKDL